MAGRFKWKPFAEIDITDPFFDSLKADYPEFATTWFPKCIQEGRNALVFSDTAGLGAFIALKQENEPIELQERAIPASPRLKVSTLLLAPRFRGQRLGEGALGLVLWNWQRSKLDEVYLTVFPQHVDLITQLERFGFQAVGHNNRNELVYMRSRKEIDFSDPYKSFPFVLESFNKGGYLIINDEFHDTLFPYSELKNTAQEMLQIDAANGISKVYVGQMWDPHYRVGEPIFIYRRYTGAQGTRAYKSCLTSYCVVTDVVVVKENWHARMTFERFLEIVGNKTIYTLQELQHKYNNDRNVTLVTMLYCGYFGAGFNINMAWLRDHNLWANDNEYPTRVELSPAQCQTIWQTAHVDLDDVFGR